MLFFVIFYKNKYALKSDDIYKIFFLFFPRNYSVHDTKYTSKRGLFAGFRLYKKIYVLEVEIKCFSLKKTIN